VRRDRCNRDDVGDLARDHPRADRLRVRAADPGCQAEAGTVTGDVIEDLLPVVESREPRHLETEMDSREREDSLHEATAIRRRIAATEQRTEPARGVTRIVHIHRRTIGDHRSSLSPRPVAVSGVTALRPATISVDAAVTSRAHHGRGIADV
jgi:hypothetical protein